MTKQEKIRGGIKTFIFMEGSCGDLAGNKLTDDILTYLHKQGVVIKVERELPDLLISDDNVCNIECHRREQFNLTSAGYVAVEGLF